MPVKQANLYNNCACAVSKCKSPKPNGVSGPNGAGCGVYMRQVQTGKGVGPNGDDFQMDRVQTGHSCISLIFT